VCGVAHWLARIGVWRNCGVAYWLERIGAGCGFVQGDLFSSLGCGVTHRVWCSSLGCDAAHSLAYKFGPGFESRAITLGTSSLSNAMRRNGEVLSPDNSVFSVWILTKTLTMVALKHSLLKSAPQFTCLLKQ